MQIALAVLHDLVKIAGLLYAAQFLVGAFRWSAREQNPVYRLLRFLLSPVTSLVRAVTPKAVADQHVPLVAFLLLFWLYVALLVVRLYFQRPDLFA